MAELPRSEIERRIAAVPHWHHRIAFSPEVSSPGSYDPSSLLARLGLGDLRGKRVLDVGTRDGFFAFACERLGAEVVAIDNYPPQHTGFEVAKEILGSRVEYQLANVYDVTSEQLGTFDVVLFLGVIYHLRHPLLALDRLRALCRGELYLESLVCDEAFFTDLDTTRSLRSLAPDLAALPLAQFLPYGRFHSDWTNKWVPNVACLRALVEDALFVAEEVRTWGDRALVRARVTEVDELRQRREQDRGVG